MSRPDRVQDETMDDIFLQDDLGKTIAEHATYCSKLFHKYMVLPDIVPDPTVMDDQLARFILWTSNMDVYGALNVSLDYRLRFSPTIVDIIHQLLDIICDTLESLKQIEQPVRVQLSNRKRQRISEHTDLEIIRRADEDTSDSDSDLDRAAENTSKIVDTIGGTVTRLYRLSNAVRRSAKANRAHKIEKFIDNEEANKAIAELRLYTECYIRFRFPMAPDALRSAMVEANALRLRRLYYQRYHRRRIGLSATTMEPRPNLVQLPKMNHTAAAVRFAPNALPTTGVASSEVSASPRLQAAPLTTATTAKQTVVGAFYAKSTTEIPRAKSVLVNNKLSFPPIPPTLECPYCGVIIEFREKRKSMLWHNHVIADLEPFICIFDHCLGVSQNEASSSTFETSKAWIGHMQNAHGHTWECRSPAHNYKIFGDENEYHQHCIKEHDVPEGIVATLSSAVRRPGTERVKGCPFGDDFQGPDQSGLSSGSLVFSSEGLQLHIAAHLKEIALLTLQKLPSDGDEDADHVGSDIVSEHDAQGPPQPRASMCSLLDDEDLDYQDEDSSAAIQRGPGNDDEEEEINAGVTALGLEDNDRSGMTQLHRAVQAGDLHLAKSLIQVNASVVGSKDKKNRTALHYAAMDESGIGPEMIRLLLDAAGQALVDLGDDSGQTALHYAVEKGLAESTGVILDHGADMTATDAQGFSPWLWAVVAGHPILVSTLLTSGVANVNASSKDGKSALGWAAGLGRSSIAQLLITHGASLNQDRSAQMTPLEEAAAVGCFDIVRLLLQAGADPNFRGRDNWTALHWAAEESHLGVVQLLLEAGANVNAISSYGTAPLHCAANGGQVPIVSLLLQEGADPLRTTCHGWTALHHASFMGHSHVVQRLLEDERVRASASLEDNDGWSVLHLAVHRRDLTTVDILLGGRIINEPQTLLDQRGLSAEDWLNLQPGSHSYKATSNLAFGKSRCCRATTHLRQAVLTGSVPMIRLLINSGHSIDGTDSGRRTALYYAAKKQMLSIVDLLLEMGANHSILPTGRRTWEEFIPNREIILRLNRAGYERHGTDPEVDRQIKYVLRPKGFRRSAQDRSVAFTLDEPSSTSPMSDGSALTPMMDQFPFIPSGRSFPASAAPPASLSPDPSSPARSPSPPSTQTKDNKRKAKDGRGKKFWQLFR
ncbi:hypothetical protein SUNI508_13950 [Seiridium unicorne]|uniref:Ankyrin repeat protein n=1 Tax=Seiridium unicorne TaxID=138068 RepID=A0ABR2VB00_9PEZI